MQLFLLVTIIWICFWQNLRCGTTGVVTFLRGQTLHVAWLGDSQVILVRRGQVVELMKPHKPDREVIVCTCSFSVRVKSTQFIKMKAKVESESQAMTMYVRNVRNINPLLISNQLSRFYSLKVEVQHFRIIIIYLFSFCPKSQMKGLIPLSSCVIWSHSQQPFGYSTGNQGKQLVWHEVCICINPLIWLCRHARVQVAFFL